MAATQETQALIQSTVRGVRRLSLFPHPSLSGSQNCDPLNGGNPGDNPLQGGNSHAAVSVSLFDIYKYVEKISHYDISKRGSTVKTLSCKSPIGEWPSSCHLLSFPLSQDVCWIVFGFGPGVPMLPFQSERPCRLELSSSWQAGSSVQPWLP